MRILNEKASIVVGRVAKNQKLVTFDPFLIVAVIGLAIQMIGLWWNCKKDAKSCIEMAKNPGPIENLKLRRGILRLKRKNQLYGADPKELQNNIFKTLSECTEIEMKGMMKEAVHLNCAFNHTKLGLDI